MSSESSSKKKKVAATAAAAALAAALLIGGTYSYFTAESDTVVNTFSTNEVDVSLYETDANGNQVTENSYDIIPGTSQDKDPTVYVDATVDTYVYLVVTDDTDGLVTYEVNTDVWKVLYAEGEYADNVTVYYKALTAEEIAELGDDGLNVLVGDTVSYSTSLENSDMLDEDGNLLEDLTLSFKAYAIQQESFSVDADGNAVDDDSDSKDVAASAKAAFLYANGTYVIASTQAELVAALESTDVEYVAMYTNAEVDEEITIGNTANSYNSSLTSGDELETVEKTLDLNGYDLTVSVSSGVAIRVEYGADLTITDSSEDGSGTITTPSSSGTGIYIGTESSVTLDSGTITGSTGTRNIYLPYSTSSFTMTGGAITGNTITRGGAAQVGSGTFTMSGGTISDNASTYAAIYLSGDGTVNISGGTITGNTGDYGGAINVSSSSGGTVNVSGGTITGNSTTRYGGAIYAQSGTVSLTGGTVANNTASISGDDISTTSKATLSIATDNVNSDSVTYTGDESGETIDGWYSDEGSSSDQTSRYTAVSTSTAVTEFSSETAYNIVAAYAK